MLRASIEAGMVARGVLSIIDRMPSSGMVRVYLRPGESPPRGLPVHVGPRGGRYVEYYPGDPRVSGWVRSASSRQEDPARAELRSLFDGLLRDEEELASVKNDLAHIQDALDFIRDPESPEREELERQYDEAADAYADLKRRVIAGRRRLHGMLEAHSFDWLSEVLDTQMLAEAVDSVRTLGDFGVGGGIHKSNTFVAETVPGVLPEDDHMHPTRVLHKVGMFESFDESDVEVAMWAMDRLFGFDLVPQVWYASILKDGRSGHVMRWVDHSGEPGGTAVLARKGWKEAIRSRRIRDDLIRMFALDFIAWNADRHPGNFVVDLKAERAFAIDNGYALWDRHVEFDDDYDPGSLAEVYSISALDRITPEDEREFERVQRVVRERALDALIAVSQVYSHDQVKREKLLRIMSTRIRKFLAIPSLEVVHEVLVDRDPGFFR